MKSLHLANNNENIITVKYLLESIKLTNEEIIYDYSGIYTALW